MLKRTHFFSEIKGHPRAVEYFEEHIKNDTLPNYFIIDGEEGLGKTSFADVIAISLIYGLEDSEERRKACTSIIDNNKSNDNIKKFKMSVEGGKDIAKDVLAEFNLSMTPNRKKVIICDECQGMSEAAQDVLIQDLEFIPKGLTIILLTTKKHILQSTLQSRAVPMHLQRLKQSDMLNILKTEVSRRNLNVQGGDATLSLIATWAECKPRTALNILSAFADNSVVNSSTIKEFIGYLEVEDVLPLVKNLAGSMTFGLSYISELKISDSIVDILVEMMKIKQGHASYRLQFDEIKAVRTALTDVSEKSLVTFIYKLTSFPKLTRQALISSFMQAHESVDRLYIRDNSILREELQQKGEEVPETIKNTSTMQAPTLEDLALSGSVIVE